MPIIWGLFQFSLLWCLPSLQNILQVKPLNLGEGPKPLKLEIIIFNAFINKVIPFSPQLLESLASETEKKKVVDNLVVKYQNKYNSKNRDKGIEDTGEKAVGT